MPSPAPDELIDRVDDADRVVGVVRRADALAEGAGFRTVHVIVENAQHELLLQQIGPSGTRHPGRWGSSVAGYLHAGEDPREGAARRAREELGLRTELTELACVHMRDGDSSKFVHVYATLAEAAHIADPEHVAGIAFWERAAIREQLARDPHVFTETFAHVFEAVEGDGARC